jgi:hypothetical protein
MCETDPAIIQERAEIAKDSIPEVDPLTVLENRAKEADVMEGQLTLLTAEVAELKAFIENYDRLADVAADVITELNEKVMEEQSKNTKLAKALLAIVSWTETMDNLMAEITKDLLE